MAQGKREQLLSSVAILTQDLQRMRDKPEGRPNDAPNKFGCSEKPSLSFGSNKEIKCASSAIALKYTEDKGRHLIATENLRPGKISSIAKKQKQKTHLRILLQLCSQLCFI